jgi:hypothetical protein
MNDLFWQKFSSQVKKLANASEDTKAIKSAPLYSHILGTFVFFSIAFIGSPLSSPERLLVRNDCRLIHPNV